MTRCWIRAAVLAASATTMVWLANVASTADESRLRDVLHSRTLKLLQDKSITARDAIGILVEPGSKEEAQVYYARIGKLLGLDIEKTTLGSILQFYGYSTISAADFEALDSFDLMPRNDTDFDRLASLVTDSAAFKREFTLGDFTGGQVLVSRFFAPKIVNFNDISGTGGNTFVAGWRKLVRLQPRANSSAAGKSLGPMYVLFNYFEKDPKIHPFKDKQSQNNQVIIVNQKFTPTKDDSIFWLVYQKRDTNYAIAHSLFAGFDIPGPRDYFVPTACAQCHGHDEEFGGPVGGLETFPFGKVNYLDTDQWYDVAKFDFPGTQAEQFDVVFDGTKNMSSADYRRAIDVLRQLNREIAVQTTLSLRPDGSEDYKKKAVEKWNELHATSDAPAAQGDRSLSVGQRVWLSTDTTDVKTLGELNRYCFRCHSSMYYHVFDKQAVFSKKRMIESFLRLDYMPQGRILDDSTKRALIDLIHNMQ
jgi:hypothetical protein